MVANKIMKTYHLNANQKSADILKADKIGFKAKKNMSDREKTFHNESIYQEDVINKNCLI